MKRPRFTGRIAKIYYPLRRALSRAARTIRIRRLAVILQLRHLIGRRPPGVPTACVVSFTSHGERLSRAHLTVESILRGSRRPSAVELWLPMEEVRRSADLPRPLRRLEKRRLLNVRFAEENFRPGNKLVHALRQHPDQPVVTIDDDKLYPPDFLDGLWETHIDQPGIIVCWEAHTLDLDSNGRFPDYEERHEGRGITGPTLSLIAHGVGGVLYPPGSLHPDVYDLATYRRLADRVDDLWFKAQSLRQLTPVQRVAAANRSTYTVPGSQRNSLWSENRDIKRNSKAWHALDDTYKLHELWP